MRSITVVTTSHERGYAGHGREMLYSFDAHWPGDIRLRFYHEGFEVDPPSARVDLFDLNQASPDLIRFKQRHQDHPKAHGMMRKRWKLRLGRFRLAVERPWGARRYRYRWDAVRFSHKMYAIFHAAATCDSDVLIWIDADTRFFAPVDRVTIESFVPSDCFVGCLKRTMMHTECGLVAYNLRHPATLDFLRDLARFYDEDGFLQEQEFHDSWLFDVARRRAEARGHRSHDIADGIGAQAVHVLVNSRLGAFMDHMKGDRKDSGKSYADDLIVDRAEAYWQRSGERGADGRVDPGGDRG